MDANLLANAVELAAECELAYVRTPSPENRERFYAALSSLGLVASIREIGVTPTSPEAIDRIRVVMRQTDELLRGALGPTPERDDGESQNLEGDDRARLIFEVLGELMPHGQDGVFVFETSNVTARVNEHARVRCTFRGVAP